MFGIFNKGSGTKKLERKYQKLIDEAYTLSTTNRKLSDLKTAEADEVLKQIERLKENA